MKHLVARAVRVSVLACASVVLACSARDAEVASDAWAAPRDTTAVHFDVDTGRRFAISPFIYGVNFYGERATGIPWPDHLTLGRVGGNRLTAYNWRNNASNAGRDWNFQNDDYLGGDMVPGEAVRARVAAARDRNAAMIVTVPMIGYVARDKDGTSVGTEPSTLGARLAARFVRSLPTRDPSSAAAGDDATVYQDEFVAWLDGAFPGATTSATTPIFFALDNEPDLWGSTHEEIMPRVAGGKATLTYDQLVDRSIAYARAIKRVDSNAVIFGPGTATWTGATTLGRYPAADPTYGRRDFLDVYLERMRAASEPGARRLLDVLDLHWYPAAGADGEEIDNDMAAQSPAMIEARLQAPRSLWDPGYDEHSWVSRVRKGPIRLLPLLREKIARYNPGMKLAITEYFYGRAGDISGGVAQADVLGVFGREGVFAATLWPLARLDASPYGGGAERAYRYVIGAFRMYRDYDGQGSAFGAIGLAAHTSDSVATSVYASTDDDHDARVVLVAINKRPYPRPASIRGLAALRARPVEVYTLTANAPDPQRADDIRTDSTGVLRYTLPPMSVSTLVVRR